MRPYLIFAVVIVMAAAAFGQGPGPYAGGCIYGCGPYVPRLTTPEISFQQVSPNPVGATNATTGLIAGATNSTLSEVNGSTDSVHSEAVWEQGGGAPMISPDVHLWPEPIGREGRPLHAMMHEMMHEEGAREERREEPRGHEKARASWTYIAEWQGAAESPAEAAQGKGSVQHGHVYTNDDVTRQNDKNGQVKWDSKSEKIQ